MATVEMAFAGYIKGMRCYAPIDNDAVDTLIKLMPDVIVCDIPTPDKQRTLLQNASMHKYFTWLAKALNDAGYSFSFQGIKGMDIEIDYDKGIIKQFVWGPIMKAITGITKTSKLETHHVSIIHDHLNRYTAGEKGISVPFPSREQLMRRDQHE